ncbi:LCP family protein [Lapillicoccus jejuensis]|uniref:LytR family transcriptional attenuator n=1 Tax=Lapillicoccus jejuensis TaxID=402171 RepID=A0A542DYG2_9MICO|nr:LCP family protein [Lapillicoccus jejuensis]TQJ08127.1 LytR family transcriptional attenuator [Lapillicoccus jejuensis]
MTAPAPRHRAPRRSHRLRNSIIGLVVLALVAVVGFVVVEYVGLKKDLTTSDALAGNTPSGTETTSSAPRQDTNILIMGLDSRVDVHGNPLPQDIYEALHAGDQSDGGLNSNVLMLLHIPAQGKAVEISIPRDDYVPLHGCPDGTCTEKIKQAYGLAVDQEQRRLAGSAGNGMTAAEKYQKARDAGRLAQVQTVQDFLQVHIDHFVEVTMVAFYQLAQVVQPIKVCLLHDTSDRYSGADFKAGEQEIDAAQALAFVRQRRDPNTSLNFTDLDRSRRQQAFITSLATQMKDAGVLTNPVKINGILDVVKQNTAVDSGLDLFSFLGQARDMAGGNVSYYTLPVKEFGQNARGEDVNIVDTEQIRAIVTSLLSPAPTGSTPSTSSTTSAGTSTGPTSSATTSSSAPTTSGPQPVPATKEPAPTDLSQLSGGGVPCVK